MPPVLTTEQILALAPDASSAKSGKDLATPRKWVTLGHNEQVAWGECQGSGKTPYQTQIDLSEPAFRCSCPSRKFPCKHGLGLFLLLASQPKSFSQNTPPQWVADWLASRVKRVQQRATKEAAAADKPPDPATQARRAADRQAKVSAGLADLERWLCDLVRQGLAAVQGQPYSFWSAPAARLVDAQASGLARLVKQMAGVVSSGEGWQGRLLERLGLLYLLLEGFKRIEELPPATQADIRALIGWTQAQEELRAEPGQRDHWLVLGQRAEEEERLRVQLTWLWGRQSNRGALVLQYAHGGQPLDTGFVPGTTIDAELVFYPSAAPLRALVKERYAPPSGLDEMIGFDSVADAVAAYAGSLARNPWLEAFPLPLRTVTIQHESGRWAARDTAGELLPITPRFAGGWRLLALGGGRPLSLFGEWDGVHLTPLSVWSEGRFIPC